MTTPDPAGEDAAAPRECVYCGATAELVADEHIEELWYCRACRARRDAHHDIIAEGCDGEDPSYE